MVIEDNRPSGKLRGSAHHPTHLPIAHPMDRMAAFLVDVSVLVVSGSLIVAPIQKKIRAAQLVSESETMLIGFLLMLLTAGILSVVYQTLFVAWRGQTIGKRIFGLKVVDIWESHTPRLSDAFFRAVLWWFDVILGALPTLGIYSDPLRRAFHDRVSNTIVISLRGRTARPPERSEISIVKAIFVAIYLLGFTVILEETRLMYATLDADESTHLLQLMSPVQCDHVSDAIQDWPVEEGRSPSRVSVGLALFAAGVIDEECLNKEAFYEFRNGEQHEMAYMARAFVTSDESELSDQYLTKVCEYNAESQACRLSQVISLWTEKQWSKATEDFDKLLPHSSVFVKTWAIKHFEKIKDFDRELKVIETLWPLESLSGFLASHRTIALWGLRRYEESRVAANAAVEMLRDNKRLGLASWMCFHEMEKGCVSTPTCEYFARQAEERITSFDFDLYAVTYIKLKDCKNELTSEELAGVFENDTTMALVRGLESLHRQDDETAIKSFKFVIDNGETAGVVAHEARKRLLELTSDSDTVSELAALWMGSDPTELWNWIGEGERLASKLVELKHYADALRVGSRVLKRDPLAEEARKAAVVAAYHEEKIKMAREFLAPLERRQDRRPASQSEFDRIRKSLRGEP